MVLLTASVAEKAEALVHPSVNPLTQILKEHMFSVAPSLDVEELY